MGSGCLPLFSRSPATGPGARRPPRSGPGACRRLWGYSAPCRRAPPGPWSCLRERDPCPLPGWPGCPATCRLTAPRNVSETSWERAAGWVDFWVYTFGSFKFYQTPFYKAINPFSSWEGMPLLAFQLMATRACFELEKKRQDKIFLPLTSPSHTQSLPVSLGDCHLGSCTGAGEDGIPRACAQTNWACADILEVGATPAPLSQPNSES